MVAALAVRDHQPTGSFFKFTTSNMLAVGYLGNMTR